MTKRLLSVTADLTVDVAGHRVCVRGEGSSIFVEVPSVAVAFEMMRDLAKLNLVRIRTASVLETLSHVGLTIIVGTPTRRLATIGSGCSSWLLSLFGVPHTRLHLS